jgi:hypothetical protein
LAIAIKYPLVRITISELLENGQLQEAIAQRDLQLQEIAEINKSFTPKSVNNHMIISDNLDRVYNPADGKHYDSKSKYYEAVKSKGCHIVEKGQTTRRLEADHNVRKELTQATREVLNRR